MPKNSYETTKDLFNSQNRDFSCFTTEIFAKFAIFSQFFPTTYKEFCFHALHACWNSPRVLPAGSYGVAKGARAQKRKNKPRGSRVGDLFCPRPAVSNPRPLLMACSSDRDGVKEKTEGANSSRAGQCGTSGAVG